jgi:hypothetical protein
VKAGGKQDTLTFNGLHIIMQVSEKAELFIIAFVRTSDPTK